MSSIHGIVGVAALSGLTIFATQNLEGTVTTSVFLFIWNSFNPYPSCLKNLTKLTASGLQPHSEGAAPVGVGHTTKRPKPYGFTGDLASMAKTLSLLVPLGGGL